MSDPFTDPGATATDPSTDSTGSPQAGSGQATDLTSQIVESVSPSVQLPVSSFQSPGLYTLTYTITDAAGNSGSVSRVVTVLHGEPPVVSVIEPVEPVAPAAPASEPAPTP